VGAALTPLSHVGINVNKDVTFARKRPCSNCPFRNDEKAIELSDGRLEDIITSLLTGREVSFNCHKTVYGDLDDIIDGNTPPVAPSVCPGAAAVARKFGRDMVIIQVGTRMGVIESNFLDDALSRTIEPESLHINKKDVHL
tara:strand:+ start:2239 stop:2661 length:423 start_codon:yes stop_codon:yes gene_type:complete